MSTTVQFRQATQAADEILKADKAKEKLQWARLTVASMPKDIQRLALEYIGAELAAKAMKAQLQAALDDKVDAPSGKRLLVTAGRDIGPDTDFVLVAWAKATSGQTKVLSFDQFVKG